jgi:hypothetical protein
LLNAAKNGAALSVLNPTPGQRYLNHYGSHDTVQCCVLNEGVYADNKELPACTWVKIERDKHRRLLFPQQIQ